MKDYRLIVGAAVLTGLTLSFAPAIGAQGNGGAGPGSSTAPAGTPASGPGSAETDIEGAALQSTGQPLGDYVPCEFSTAELMRLRPAPVAERLTDADSEALKQDVIAVARKQQIGSSAAKDSYLDNFIQAISGERFAGKSQSESLETIMADYATNVKNPSAQALQGGLSAEVASFNLHIPAFDNVISLTTTSSTPPETIKSQIKNAGSGSGAVATNIATDVTAPPTAGQETTIVDTARQATAAFLQPQDVACAMTILTYVETREAFGTLVAKNYIAVQINVRNLNISQDFQIHDAELAVDSDPSGRHGRYFSGSDKRVVRAFAVAQQSFDARNLTVNITQNAGALLNTIVPLVGGTFADAVGVITGGAIPGLSKTWKDSTTDQLNLLSDTAYSPGTNGTSVPRNSVVQFMMFVPSKPFEQGWWTLPCANNVYLASQNSGKYLPSNTEIGFSGVDVDRQLEPCLVASTSHSDIDGSQIATYTMSRDGTGSATSDIFTSPVPLPYKKWSGSMLGIFRELALTAVAGVHTVEASQLAASISNVNCQRDKQGNILFDGTDPIVCQVAGQNLGGVKTLRLRNSDDPSDSSDYALQPKNGDPTSGTVSFDATKLAALNGAAYTVFMVDGASGTETKTSVALNLIKTLNPVLLKIGSGTDTTVDLAQSPPTSITIYGSHLNGIGKIVLTSKTDNTINDLITPSKTSAFSLVFDLSTAAGVKGKVTTTTPMTISVSLQPSAAGATPVVTSLTFPVIKSH